jgi:hypothetical protein
VCRLKHVEPSINFGIINSITKLHLVGISTMHGSMNIKGQTVFTDLLALRGKDTALFKTSGVTHPTTDSHIPEELGFHSHR